MNLTNFVNCWHVLPAVAVVNAFGRDKVWGFAPNGQTKNVIWLELLAAM